MQIAGRLVAVGAIVFAFVTQLAGGLNPDASWLLTVGERMLAGQQLYIDIYELNPPMSALLYLPFVALAQALGIAAEPVVVGAVLMVAMASLALSAAILRRGDLLANSGQWWLISIVGLTILPGGDFGEREHIAVILLLPILAVSAVRSIGKAPSLAQLIIAGVAAGIVMTIKPHFALPILMVAIYSAARMRSWRVIFSLEHVLAGLVVMAYWLGVWAWFPSFFSAMLPLASVAYIADRASLSALLFGMPVLPIWLMLAGLVLLYRREMVLPPNAHYVVAALGFFLVYLIQGKGFVYHLLPSLMLVSMVFAQCFVARNGQGASKVLPVALALILVAAPGSLNLRGNGLRNEAMSVLRPFGPGLRIANLTPQLEIASPLHRDLGATLVNSGPCLWVALGALRRQAGTTDVAVQQEMVALQDSERRRLREDMIANPPDIILAGGDRFDWIGWAGEDPQLKAILLNYEPIAELGPEDRALAVLKRKSI